MTEREQTEGMVEPPHDVLQSALRRSAKKVYPPEQTGDALAALGALLNQAYENSDDHEKALIEEAGATVRHHLTASGVPERGDVSLDQYEQVRKERDLLAMAIRSMPGRHIPEGMRRLPEAIHAKQLKVPHDDVADAYNDGLHVAEDVVRDALALASAPADGWKLVPVEPTEEMIEAGCPKDPHMAQETEDVYRAMIAAAPTDGRE